MPTYLTPGVYFETVDTGRGLITALRTDVAAFVGIAERGPLHTPTPVSSWAQFRATFGGYIPGGYLAYSAKAFFDNGGRLCYIVRIAAETARAASGVLLDRAGLPTVQVEASSPGTWGQRLTVRTAHNSPAATRARAALQPADRSGSYAESIVGFPIGSLVKIFQEQMPAPLVTYRVVAATHAGNNLLVWDTPLDPAYNLALAISFETIEFSLSVYLDGRLQENFTGLSLTAASNPDCDLEKQRVRKCHAADVVNRTSHFIRIADLGSPTLFPDRLPDPGAANLIRGALSLQGGQDGLAALRLSDFTGDPGLAPKRGLRALEDVDEVAIVAVPDILIQPAPPIQFAPLPVPQPDPCLPCAQPPPIAPPVAPSPIEQPPLFSLDEVFRVQQALIDHCEAQRDRIAVLDPPAPPLTGEVDLGEIQSWRQRFESKYAALYYPWVLVVDPLRLGGRIVRAVPPSGHVAGSFARTDLEVGVHKAPANVELRWAQAPALDINAEVQGLLNPLGINCIRVLPGRGLRLYGARTVSSDADWRYVNVRRLMMMIEEAVEDAIQWSVFEPNDYYLRQTLILAISSFLRAMWQRGVLVGETEGEAFFVRCDDANNPPDLADLGQLVVEVGVAPTRPAEFVVFRIGRADNTLEVSE